MIQQELHAIQHEHGYLPVDALKALSVRINVPLHRIHEVASCFPHYRMDPPPAVEIKVCRDMACHLRGAPEFIRSLQEMAAEVGGGQVAVGGVSCLGQCDAAPAVMVGHHVYRNRTISECRALLRDAMTGREARITPSMPLAARPAATGWLIDPYDGREDYAAVRKFVSGARRRRAGRGAEGLRPPRHGRRGRPGHPEVERRPPGAGRPRSTSSSTPTRASPARSRTASCSCGPRTWSRRRDPRPAAHRRRARATSTSATSTSRRSRRCARRSRGPSRWASAARTSWAPAATFPVEVYVSPGGYICGEQSALIEAMEDKRAEPRNKPPMLETNGYLRQADADHQRRDLRLGPGDLPQAAASGTATWGSTAARGPAFFSICGDVDRPGVYEVPNGLHPRPADRRATPAGCATARGSRPSPPRAPPAGSCRPRLPPKDLAAAARERERSTASRHLDLLDVLTRPPDVPRHGPDAGRRPRRLRRRRRHGGPGAQRHRVLPQRVVRQVRPLPDRLRRSWWRSARTS